MTTEEPAKTKDAARRSRLPVALILVGLAFLASLYAWPFLLPRLAVLLPWDSTVLPDARKNAARDAALAKKLQRLESLQEDLGGRFDGLAAREGRNADRLADLAARLDDAEAALRGHEARLSALRALTEIEGRVAALEEARPADPSRVLLALAASRLRIEAAESPPFAESLWNIAALAERSGTKSAALAAAIKDLEPLALAGAPSRFDLKASLGEHIRAAARADAPSVDAPWWRRILSRLGRLVTIRRLDGGGALENRLARGEKAMARNDLSGTVTELAKLTGGPAGALGDWLRAARARLVIDRASARLEAAAFAALGDAAAAPGAARGAR